MVVHGLDEVVGGGGGVVVVVLHGVVEEEEVAGPLDDDVEGPTTDVKLEDELKEVAVDMLLVPELALEEIYSVLEVDERADEDVEALLLSVATLEVLEYAGGTDADEVVLLTIESEDMDELEELWEVLELELETLKSVIDVGKVEEGAELLLSEDVVCEVVGGTEVLLSEDVGAEVEDGCELE